jgi:hypothetical protein
MLVKIENLSENKSRMRSYGKLSGAISEGLKTITAADAGNWIRHCGYV